MLDGSHCHADDLLCYRLVFELESHLRAIVRWELRGHLGKAWEGAIPEDIRKEAVSRREQERILRVLSEGRGLLSFLSLSELKDLITGPAWDYLKNTWPPRDIVLSELKKLIGVRNKIAHFRSATAKDARLLRRFAEDFRDWTRHYDRTRRYAPSCDAGDSDDIASVERLGSITSWWEPLLTNGQASRFELQISLVSHHFAVEGSAVGPDMKPDAFVALLNRFGKVISFLRVGDLGERFCCYVPRCLEATDIARCLDEFVEFLATSGPAQASSDVREALELASREELLPWAIDLPCPFPG